MTEIYDERELADLEVQLDRWLAELAAAVPAITAVERGAHSDAGGAERRWFVRMRGDSKDVTTVWLTLGQRTLRYETYVMPAPATNAAAVYEFALRRNEQLVGVHFAIGAEDALFLHGALPLAALSPAELDRAIGTTFATVERYFPSLIALGFAGRAR